MGARKFYQYLKAIEPIQAQETLANISSTAYPHLDKRRRKEVYKDLQETIKNSIKKENLKPAKFGDVKNLLLRALKRG